MVVAAAAARSDTAAAGRQGRQLQQQQLEAGAPSGYAVSYISVNVPTADSSVRRYVLLPYICLLRKYSNGGGGEDFLFRRFSHFFSLVPFFFSFGFFILFFSVSSVSRWGRIWMDGCGGCDVVV